ncbi:MAG: bifunctional hydroxymethylpyrimidine kinase/phosphomethylpyrimidine kinase [Alphaproteobacteria bacterium]|nr:bifunctional hydroxymethylpyrimidine kinase/phosphomethylpyrimidine kinase [Alphaproteobacteria bacterium]
MNGKIFAIAGSDPGGGAGIQADIKTISALGGYAMAAVTALTVQDTRRVYAVHPVRADIVAAQVTTLLKDITPDAIKVGMMGTADIVEQLARIFAEYRDIPLIIDPVMLSSSGHRLLDDRAVAIMTSALFPLTRLITPNLAEAAVLTGHDSINSLEDMRQAGEKLRAMGPQAVLITGGHLAGDRVTDVLVTASGIAEFSSPLIPTRHTHGTGCTLASAVATGIGQGMALTDAVARAHKYVHKAIEQAPGFGHGAGPLNHLVALD